MDGINKIPQRPSDEILKENQEAYIRAQAEAKIEADNLDMEDMLEKVTQCIVSMLSQGSRQTCCYLASGTIPRPNEIIEAVKAKGYYIQLDSNGSFLPLYISPRFVIQMDPFKESTPVTEIEVHPSATSAKDKSRLKRVCNYIKKAYNE